MRYLPFAIAVVASVGLIGCLGDDDQPAQPSAEAGTALDCPGGDDDLRSASFDLGENPQGVPSARGALERFLLSRTSDLSADAFERTDGGSGAPRKANFSYSRGESRLADIYVERLERGWLVISYDYCRGIIGPLVTEPRPPVGRNAEPKPVLELRSAVERRIEEARASSITCGLPEPVPNLGAHVDIVAPDAVCLVSYRGSPPAIFLGRNHRVTGIPARLSPVRVAE
jgi:hypothetical protein